MYDPEHLSFPFADELTPLQRANELVVWLCCVGDEFSLPMLAGSMRAATHPVMRAVLERIVRPVFERLLQVGTAFAPGGGEHGLDGPAVVRRARRVDDERRGARAAPDVRDRVTAPSERGSTG